MTDVPTTKFKPQYVRTSTSELYYRRDANNSRLIHATQKLKDLCVKFRSDVLSQREKFRRENHIFDEPDHSNLFHRAKQFGSNHKTNKSQRNSKGTATSIISFCIESIVFSPAIQIIQVKVKRKKAKKKAKQLQLV